jgi:hypothetical protein
MKKNSTTQSSYKDAEWIFNWHSQKNIEIKRPKFKYCKRREEFFSDSFEDVWYKSPYKYNMLVEMSKEAIQESRESYSDITANIRLVYENLNVISGDAVELISMQQAGAKLLIKFQFGICSYKHDGRKFKLFVDLYSTSKDSNDRKKLVSMISPAFEIKAKRPATGVKRKRKVIEQPTGKFSSDEYIIDHDAMIAYKKTKFDKIPSYYLFNQPQIHYQRESKKEGTHKVNTILSVIDTLSRWEQKYVLCKMIEKCNHREKDYIRKQFFVHSRNTGKL